jgi:hypothetical protein
MAGLYLPDLHKKFGSGTLKTFQGIKSLLKRLVCYRFSSLLLREMEAYCIDVYSATFGKLRKEEFFPQRCTINMKPGRSFIYNPIIRYVVTTGTRYNPVNTNYSERSKNSYKNGGLKGVKFKSLVFNF